MDAAEAFENVTHEMMLRDCKNEEECQWENARHEIMSESIQEIIQSKNKYNEEENER